MLFKEFTQPAQKASRIASKDAHLSKIYMLQSQINQVSQENNVLKTKIAHLSLENPKLLLLHEKLKLSHSQIYGKPQAFNIEKN